MMTGTTTLTPSSRRDTIITMPRQARCGAQAKPHITSRRAGSRMDVTLPALGTFPV